MNFFGEYKYQFFCEKNNAQKRAEAYPHFPNLRPVPLLAVPPPAAPLDRRSAPPPPIVAGQTIVAGVARVVDGPQGVPRKSPQRV